MKIKGKLILSALFLVLFINIAFIGAASASTVNVTSSMSNSQIQSVLDHAKSGDTVNFLGLLYENIQLTINKSLNIITTVGTVLSGTNSPGAAVFLVNGSKASGTTISGFNITNAKAGIYINNTNWTTVTNNRIKSIDGSAITVNGSSNTNLASNNVTYATTGITVEKSKNTKITNTKVAGSSQNGVTVNNSENTALNYDNVVNSNKQGVVVYNSKGTTINNTSVKNSQTNAIAIYESNQTVVNNSQMTENGQGLDPGYVDPDSGSSKEQNGNGVYVEKSDKIKISNSEISENFRGISANTASNLTIENNTLIDNNFEGILLSGIIKTSLIIGNLVQANNNGIKVNSITTNLTIVGNVLTYNERKCAGCENGHGLRFGGNFQEDGSTIVEHNIITKNTYPYSQIIPGLGSNFYGDSDYESSLKGSQSSNMKLEIIRTGEHEYKIFFFDPATGEVVTDLRPVWIQVTTPDGVYWVLYTSPYVIFTTNSSVGDITVALGTEKTLPSWFNPTLIYAKDTVETITMPLNSQIGTMPNIIQSYYPQWDASHQDDWQTELPPNNGSEGDPNNGGSDSGGNSGNGGSVPGGNSGNGGSDSGGNSGNGGSVPGGSSDNGGSDSGGSSDNGGSGTGGNGNSNPGQTPTGSQGNTPSGTNVVPGVNLPAGVTALTAAVSSASAAGQQASNAVTQGKTVQELVVDGVTKPEIWGILGIIVLLVLVFGAYYRTDLMNMIRKARK